MADVFLSYSREDKDIARYVASKLSAKGLDVWWDHEIAAGDDWSEAIEGAIRGALCVVVLWSENSVASRWVKKEARFAHERNRLVPVMLDDSAIPFEFDDIQAADLRGWKGGTHPEFTRLQKWVEGIVDPSTVSAIPTREVGPRVRRESRGISAPGALLILASLATLAYFVVDPAYWDYWLGPDGEISLPTNRASGRPTAAMADVCAGAGYLCAPLENNERMAIERLRRDEGSITVHVPVPSGEDPATARMYQEAASRGIRAWSGAPYSIRVVPRPTGRSLFDVAWERRLEDGYGSIARTTWQPDSGLRVHRLEIATRHPDAPGQRLSSDQIAAMAAHAMGHALGLPDSPDQDDVMHRSLRVSEMSPDDRRAVVRLYAIEDGTVVHR